MMDEMLIASEKYLPQFAGKNRELKEKGIFIHDEKVRGMCEKGLRKV